MKPKCETCGYVFDTEKELKQHQHDRHNTKLFDYVKATLGKELNKVKFPAQRARGKCKHCVYAFGMKKVCMNHASKEFGEEHRTLEFDRRTNKRRWVDDRRNYYCFVEKRKW